MKFTELWKLSKTVSNEIIFRTLMEAYKGYTEIDQKKLNQIIKRIKSNQLLNKVSSAIFILAIVIILALPLMFTTSQGASVIIIRTTSIALFLVLSFTIIIMFGLLNSTTFVSANIIEPLRSLPLSERDSYTLTVLSFIRLNDAQIITMLFAFPIVYFIITFSIVGFILLLIFSFLNIVFALTVMLALAKVFYTRIISTAGSKIKSLLRFIFVLLWGLAVFGLYLIMNAMTYIIPIALTTVTLLPTEYFLILLLVYPFQIGYFIAVLTGPAITFSIEFLFSAIISFIYLALGRSAGKWLIRALYEISVGRYTKVSAKLIGPISLKLTSPRFAIMLKDFRLASRKPQLAFLFAFPIVFVAIYFIPLFTSSIQSIDFLVISMSTIIFMAGMLYSFFSTYLMVIDGKASSYSKILPIYPYDLLIAKAFFITILYATLPVFVISFMLFTDISLLPVISFSVSTIGAIYASACFSNLIIFRKIKAGKYSVADTSSQFLLFLQVSIVSAVIIGVPIILFFIFSNIYNTIELGLLYSGAATVLEAMIATIILKKLAKK